LRISNEPTGFQQSIGKIIFKIPLKDETAEAILGKPMAVCR
jgi:hypothetical protein